MVTPVDIQSLGADIRIYGEIDDPAMRYFNPSLVVADGGIRISIRSCNFAVEHRGKWYLRDGSAYSKTDVIYGWLNPLSLEVYGLEKLNLSKDSPKTILTAGIEDVRLFSRKDGVHAIGFESDRITRSLHNASTSMAEFVILGNELGYLRTIPKPRKETVEKNWSPTDTPSNLFDFTYSDTQVYKDGKLIGEPTKTSIHGGTQLIKQKDGTWLSIVHEKKIDPLLRRFGMNIYDKYIYHHYLAKHNEQGIITHLSKPFTFGTHENIEFAAGMVEHNDDLLISFGIRDCKYGIARIKKDKLLSLIEVVV